MADEAILDLGPEECAKCGAPQQRHEGRMLPCAACWDGPPRLYLHQPQRATAVTYRVKEGPLPLPPPLLEYDRAQAETWLGRRFWAWRPRVA